MVQCCIAGCTNISSKESAIHKDAGPNKIWITFHRFPDEETLRQSWINAIWRKNWTPDKNSMVCSEHFKPDCFQTFAFCKKMSEKAVPTVFANQQVPKISPVLSKDFCSLCFSNTVDLIDTNKIKLKYIFPEYELLKFEILKNVCLKCDEKIQDLYEFKNKCSSNIDTLNEYIQKIITREGYQNVPIKLKNILQYKENQILPEFTEKITAGSKSNADSGNLISKTKFNTEIGREIVVKDPTSISGNKIKANITKKHEFLKNKDDTVPKKIEEVFIMEDPNLLVNANEKKKLEDNKNIGNIKKKRKYKQQRLANQGKPIIFVDKQKDGTPHHTVVLFKCNKCPKSFLYLSNLVLHKQCSHPERRPHTCQVCHEKFTTASKVSQHMYYHTGVKTVPCDVCGKKFNTTKNMREHRLIHSRDKKFDCPVCKKPFADKGGLNRHLRVHAARNLKCQFCDYTCRRKYHLNAHMEIHKGPFKCEHCEVPFSQESGLKYHIARQHRDITLSILRANGIL